MSWIDRPIEKITRRRPTSAERMRVLRLRRDSETRRREYLESQERAMSKYVSQLPPTVVLVPWHLDEHGCLARAVGNNDAPAG